MPSPNLTCNPILNPRPCAVSYHVHSLTSRLECDLDPLILETTWRRRQHLMMMYTFLTPFLHRARVDLKPGDEITYNYLEAPDYVWKEPHVVSGCVES